MEKREKRRGRSREKHGITAENGELGEERTERGERREDEAGVAEVSRGDLEEGGERREVVGEKALRGEGLEKLGVEEVDDGAVGVEEVEERRKRSELAGLDAAHDVMDVRKRGLEEGVHRELAA